VRKIIDFVELARDNNNNNISNSIGIIKYTTKVGEEALLFIQEKGFV
jgi:hypothetical protein